MHRLLQFTLDLFETAAPAPAVKTDASPAVPFDQVMAAATFRHPQASREALLGETLVAYAFKRARRRNIGFSVGAEGLTVTAPRWVPLYEIDAAVKSKSTWILRKLADAGERHRRIESARIEWKDGASFRFIGETVRVALDPRHGFDGALALLETGASHPPDGPGPRLHLGLPLTASPDQIRDAVQAWLKREARQLFEQRLNHFAPQLGVRWTKLALSSAGTRWGTAHSDGTIRLNWRLIHFRLPVIDYVVAHELSHLRVMDHSPRFWDTVRTVVPDYAQLRGQLKDEALPPW